MDDATSDHDPIVSRRSVLLTSALTLPLLAGCTGAEDAEDGSPDDSTDDATGNDDQSSNDDSENGNQEGQDEQDDQEGQANQDDGGGKAEATIGELVGDDSFSMVVEGVEQTGKLGEYEEAGDGNVFVVVTVAVKNETDGDYINFNSFLQTRLKDAEDYTYEPTIAAAARPLEGGQLAPGELSRGDIVFEVPEDASGLVMQFDLEAFDLFDFNRVHIDLGAETDDPTTLEQDLRVDIHGIGDTVAENDMEVTVDDVQTATELDEYTQAEDGNEYVIPDISVTNETGEATSVSISLQMVVKDDDGWIYQVDVGGLSALDQAFEQGSELGDGETRRGKIAYQVPEGTEPLYWAFEFDLIADGTKKFWQLR